MYNPKQNEETRLDVLHALIEAHPLGTWVALGDGALQANHIPFEIDASRGEFGTLVGHVARANPIWKELKSGVPSLIIFQGPQAYVSPSWYPSKHEHGKAVPTWNYAVVHASGRPSFIEDSAWLRSHVNQLTNRHEAAQVLPWAVSDAPEDYLERMLAAIVGVEILIDNLAGNWKMNQNRSEADRIGVVAGLMSKGNSDSIGVASTMRSRLHALK